MLPDFDSSSSSSSTSSLDSDVEIDLEQQLIYNLEMIQKQYANYVDSILNIVEGKGISPIQLSSYLLNLPAFTSDKKRLRLLAGLRAELQKAETIAEVFIILSTKYVSFLDYDIFETILKHYGTPKDVEELNYPECLKAYLEKHKVNEFVKLYPKLINPKLEKLCSNSTTINVKLSTKRTQSLSTLKEVKRAVANILGIRASALRLYDVKKGCVIITLLIPTSIADVIFMESSITLEQIQQIQETSILWFECKGCRFDLREKQFKFCPNPFYSDEGEKKISISK